MTVHYRKSLLFLGLYLSWFASHGQGSGPSVTFKSPEVSAFNKSIETPVSMYTGVPNISIPLYEINIKGVSVPVTLDYHAGGIRLSQDATWVGLGWNLSYGGEISRKTRGIPDEYYYLYGGTNAPNSVNYFMQKPKLGLVPNSSVSDDRIDYINSAKRGGIDYMPDEFYYSALGYSGRFMFSQNRNKFLLYPKEDIDVSKYDGPSQTKLYSWNLKLPNGIAVNFGQEGCSKQQMSVMNLQTNVTNAWQIKSIKNTYNDTITYSYDQFNYRVYQLNGQQAVIGAASVDYSTNISNPLIYDSRIKVINFPGGRIEFSTLGRQDMPTERLDEINVYDNSNNNVKKIHFNYSYFYGEAFDIKNIANFYDEARNPSDYRYKRLRLDGISITASGLQPVNYTFDYYTLPQMPSKFSFAQDHWGYYNGIANASMYGMIPNLDPKIAGGDKRVKAEYAKLFALKSITYPEGGKKEFVYEGNTAGVWNAPKELLETYQDDNFLEKYEALSISSYSRSTSYPAPNETINGVRYFRKRFTVGGLGFTTQNNWSVNTNFGISTLEKDLPYLADNVDFKLERVNSDNSKTILRQFNTTSTSYPYNNAPARNGKDNYWVNLNAGTYEMTVAITYLNKPNSKPDNQPYNLSFFVRWRELNPLTNMINVGGLRIKEINAFNHDNVLVDKKTYSYVNPYANATIPNFTSGRLVSLPQYLQYQIGHLRDPYGVYKDYFNIKFSSNSIVPLESTSGSFAGYEYVKENHVDVANPANNLTSESRFSFVQPYFSQFYNFKTLGLTEPKEWARGKLLSKQYFKGNNLLKKEEYEYNFVSPYANNTENLEDYVESINTDLISFQSFSERYLQNPSDLPADFYDVTGADGINESCIYFYYGPFDNHVTTYGSRPDRNGNINRNTCDYTTAVPYFKLYTGFDKIKSKTTTYFDNPTTPVVQTENYEYGRAPIHYQLTKTTNNLSTGNQITNEIKYPLDLSLTGSEETGRLGLISSHQLDTQVDQVRKTNGKEEISRTDYLLDPTLNVVVPSRSKTNTGSNNSLEVRMNYEKFDKHGNLLSKRAENGISTVYIWGYNDQYPVAQVVSADYNTAISYLNLAILKNPASDAQLREELKKLYINLPNAQISTYTYKPLVGMTSQTDTKGMTTYYEYDAFGRLKFVKDQNGNIVKSNDYHYKN
ncbi:hypothetical protein DHW03_03270 [Pedobacter yonginense]|uniref:Sugar-binding protein n=1 Tax=Pedobacter yonginense TaxID=651869 RepID=A0A317EUM7_9SPHI|nr:hypothetical protein [Pedobacter yonginense]PWS28868.1 hypothetical protein DHW03_03270 [Pedobacter yonginense]